MKNKLTLRNVMICVGVLFGLLVFVFSFLAAYRVSAGEKWIEYQTTIWGIGRVNHNDGSAEILANADRTQALALPLIGAILALVGALCTCTLVFVGDKLIKDEKVRKIVMFVAGGFMVLGGVFTFFADGAMKAEFVRWSGASNFDSVVATWKLALVSSSISQSYALPIVSGILGVLGGGAIVCSQFVSDKKLGK